MSEGAAVSVKKGKVLEFRRKENMCTVGEQMKVSKGINKRRSQGKGPRKTTITYIMERHSHSFLFYMTK